MGPDPSESFKDLRPLCIKVSKEPSPTNIKELECKIRCVDPSHLTQLVEYVLFPLKLALQSATVNNEVKELVVGCIETLLTSASVCQLGTFEEMFNYLLALLSSREDGPGHVADLPEELKLVIVNCLSRLIQSSSLIVKGAFFSPRSLPILGHSVSILLALSEKEKARNLKLSALRCLSCLACSNSGENLHQQQEEDREALESAIKDSMAMSFASFIPGISTSLCRIITGDTKQGHVVLTQAIELWGDILSLVMNDIYLPNKATDSDDVFSQLVSLAQGEHTSRLQENGEAAVSNPIPEKPDKLQSIRVNRTFDWFCETSSKLKIVLERLNMTCTHPNWKVRLSLAKLCNKLLINCINSMQSCVPIMVDLLVGLTEDDYAQVASFSRNVLNNLSLQLGNGSSFLNSLLEENLHSALTSLPRLMRIGDDSKKIQSLNLVLGYLNLLGNRLSSLLNSSAHLKRLSLALVQVLEFDVSDVGIVEEQTPSLSETAVLPSETKGENPMSFPASQFAESQYPKYRFKHFTDKKVKAAVNQICNALGYYGNVALLTDHFLDLFHESKLYRKQAVYILNEIVLGSSKRALSEESNVLKGFGNADSAVGKDSEKLREVHNAVELLIREYISDANWNLVTSNPPMLHKNLSSDPHDLLLGKKETKKLKTLPFEVLNSNVQLTCLLLEAIGLFSKVCSSQFEPFLMRVLFPLMAKLGNDNAAISCSAYETLAKICQSCDYKSVDELIARNADYLVNAISLDFKYVFMNHRAPCVLKVMIQYSNADILFIIEDTLMEIFSVIDLYPDDLMYLLMKVLNVLVQMIKKWFPVPVKECGTEDGKPEVKQQIPQDIEAENPSAEDIRQFFLDYHKRKQLSLGYLDADEQEQEEGMTEPKESGDGETFEPDRKPEIPRHVQYVTQVLEKCSHFLSSKSPLLRLVVLDTIEAGVQAISQSEDQLLPLIHRIWPPMIKRFTDDEQVVAIKAVNVLCTMAGASGTFMQRRVIKDALPSLVKFLDKQSQVSIKTGPLYSQSQTFKLQLTVLRSLGILCRQLEISDTNLSPAVWVCCQYLSARQPKELQEVALETFKDFASVEPDLIWLCLNDLYCPREWTPAHPTLKPVKLGGAGPQSKEYAENVSILLSGM
ncbi:TELO2-interacting protein 1 homolog [Montipora foliosa]|uniref:TELO2-interacting protein 1 homolog n=1 Tax=Montipora foliosa TaxID=591990 RepID=UPI0035F16545